MLNILLLILKILGIILAVLVGVILLLLAVVLFVPVRYTVDAKYYDNVPDIRVRITWLLHLVRAKVIYSSQLQVCVKALVFTLYPKQEKKEKKEKKKEKASENIFDREYTAPTEQATSEGSVPSAGRQEHAGRTLPNQTEQPKQAPEEQEQTAKKAKDNKKTGIVSKITAMLEKVKTVVRTVLAKIKAFFGSLIQKKEDLQEKSAELLEKVTDPDNRELIHFLWEQLKILLGKLKPKKYRGAVRFGTGDPETTGKIAMYAAVLYGLSGMDIRIVPDFEQQVIEGELYCKGRVKLFDILFIALRVYFNKLVQKIILKKES